MASYLQLVISSLDVESSFSKWGKIRPLDEAQRLLGSLGEGTHTGSVDIQRDPAYAFGDLALSSASGAVGATIGGKLVTATAAGGDAPSADLIAAAILADATANTYVSAQSRAATGTVTISSGAGVISVTIGGILGQAPQTASVTWATSDTATATALAAAINALQNSPVVASSSAGVVTLYATTAGSGSTNTGGNSVTLSASGTGATASGALLTGGGTNANVLIKALVPGTIGNGITLAASGTGVTAPTGARLVGGVGAPGNSFTC